ncbi:hypothetical protein NX021_07650 [Cytobacillus firmus]|nr:hypothetical protein [Cytobacillus firmus]
MSLSRKISQEQLKELLEDVYKKVNQSEYIKTEEVLDEIQNRIRIFIGTPENTWEL